MTSKLDPKYGKMLSTPALLEGPRKEMIDSIQKQIDFYVRETIRLRCTQNSHLAISLLPAELLSDVFLYLVEDGLESGGAHFATGTFSFLQVCRHWNEVAVGSPQLWALWVTGASKAWPLFKSRSKDVPVSLTWRPQHNNLSPDALKDAGTPKRIRQLDFNGTYAQLENLLGPLDSTSVSVTSSIRLRGISGKKNGEHLTRFLSLPFPNLSKVDIEDFLPGPSSSIFITSNLTSLKLDVSYNSGRRYTRSQLLQILQQHPNLRELELKDGAIPSTDKSGTPVPVLLPQLVDLRLYGTEAAIAGFIDFVNMSSPLRNVVIGFQYSYSLLPALTKTIKKVLRAYYECQGLEYPRKANDLTVSSSLLENDLSFDAASPSAPAPRPTSNLQLQFVGMVPAFAGEIVSLFPLKHVHKFAVVRTDLGTEGYRKILQKMKGLSLLRLDGVYFGPVFDALTPNDGVGPTVPKLQSLTLQNGKVFSYVHQNLLGMLKGRRGRQIGLKKLVFQSCRVSSIRRKADLKDIVKKVTWESVREVDSDYEETDYEETDSEEETDSDEPYGHAFGFCGCRHY